MTITFVSTDSPRPRKVFKSNFHVLKSIQKFYHAPQNTTSCALKYSFLHVISIELLQKLAKTIVKQEKSQPSYVCNNSISEWCCLQPHYAHCWIALGF